MCLKIKQNEYFEPYSGAKMKKSHHYQGTANAFFVLTVKEWRHFQNVDHILVKSPPVGLDDNVEGVCMSCVQRQ